jgi:hypothetical protein
MAPASLNKLKMQAKKLGFSRTDLAGADRSEILEMIAQGGPETESENGKPRKKSASKAAVKKAVTKKASSARKSAPAKSQKRGPAKRQTARKPKAEASKNGYQAKGGRNILEGVDYSEHEDWNPRPGSAPDRIIKALRKFHGKREKVFEFLLPDIGDFVKAKKADGTPWDKGDGPGTRKGMLKYRTARTAWQFAIQTGQHEKAENRVTYGEGGTGAGIFKRTKAGRKAATAKPSRKGPSRKTTTAKRGPGRPRKTEAVAQAQPRKTRGTTRRRGTTTRKRKAAVRGK